jgi:hypothetical protein
VAAAEALLNGWLVMGNKSLRFEQKFPKEFGKTRGVLTNSGSSANLLMMAAMKSKRGHNFPPGTKVLMPIAGFPTTLNPTIQNGFNAGFILNFATGVPTPEEMEIAYREIREKYTGTWNAGKFILTFSNGKDEAPHLEPIPLADTDARYKELNDLIRQNIFTANEVTTPDLFGVSTPGQLGTRDQLFEGLEVFQSVYINYKQRLIEREFNRLLSASGIVGELKIKKYEIDLQKIGQ